MKRIEKIVVFIFLGLLFGNDLYSQCPNVPEICNNGIDDDCDGLIDCFDGDCSGNQSCATFYFVRDSGECEVAPPLVTGFNLVEVWRSDVFVETRGTPIVGDLDGDGIPEVVTHYHDDNTVYILDGATGQTKHTINAHLSDYSQSPAIADVDADGLGEIFLIDHYGKLKCFDHLGQPKVGFVESTISKGQGTFADVFAGNVSFADFNGDGNVEIFIGNEIFDARTGAIVAQLPDPYNASKGANNVNSHVFSAAFDILPDAFCSDCSGIELVCGNVVYSVNVTTGVLTEVSRAPNNVNDGRVSLADWDGDNQMDIVVTGFCCGDGGVIYIWDPRKQDFVTQDAAGNPLQNNPVDVQPTIAKATGLASIADFDGDGLLEIGLASYNEFITFESDLSRKWAKSVVDVSNMTTSTAFDFEGDGNVEVVYRDENHLYIFDGATGNVISKTDCGSGTRTELPIVVDVNGDGDAELVCTCSDKSGGVRGNVRVYESDSSIWMPTRSVWNTHNYVPSFVNDDLTIPKQFQNKALIKGQDLYLAQTSLINKSGNPVYPVLPDYTVSIDSVAKNCSSSTNEAHVKICMQTPNALVFDFDVSFYNGNPNTGGTLIGTQRVDHSASTIPGSGCMTLTQSVDFGKYDLHVIVNDKGTNPTNAPIVLMPECDTTNNSVFISLLDCNSPELISKDTLTICKGDTATIQTINLSNSNWNGDSLVVSSDSTAQVFPIDTTTYQLVHYVTRKELLVNSDFEDVNLAGTNAQLDASAVNGWNTTASDNKIEIWRDGFLGHSAYSGQFFAELNATQPSALYQDVSSTPGEIIRWGFAHKGRVTNETMQLNVGPTGGPYIKIGDFTDGPSAWRYYTGEYVVPAGQTSTRFLFSATDGDAAANLIDAATFEALIEYKDSIVVVVHELPELKLNDSSICAGDSVQLDAQNISSTYLWSTAETSQSIIVKKNGAYHVEIINSFGCSKRDTMNLVVKTCNTDAQVTKTDNRDKYLPGTGTQYTIVAKNNGPNDFTRAAVVDSVPKGVSANDVLWSAVAHGGATTQSQGSNMGALIDTVSIPVGDSVVYTVKLTTPVTFLGDLVNTVTITADKDTFAANNIAIDRDTVDCTFAVEGTIDAKVGAWQQVGPVISGLTYNFSSNAGTKTFTATNGPESGKSVFTVVYNNGTGNHISLTKDRYNSGNSFISSISGLYDNTPHAWTGLSGVGSENAPILGFMAFIDQNGNGNFDSGSEEYIRDVNQLTMTPSTTGELYMAFYDDGVYTDNAGVITIKASLEKEEVSLATDFRICKGDSVEFDAGNPSAISWDWNSGESTQLIHAKSTGQYVVKVTTFGGCFTTDTMNLIVDTVDVLLPPDTGICIGESWIIDAGLHDTWAWNTGDSTQTITVDSAGIYEVKVTNQYGCRDSDQVVLAIHNLPLVDLGPDSSICNGDSVLLNAQNPGSKYLWNTTEITQNIQIKLAGNYDVIVSDVNGCIGKDTMNLIVNQNPLVDLGPDVAMCIGDSTTIDAGVWKTYSWTGGATSSSIVVHDSSQIILNVTDDNDCKGKDTIEIIINQLPIVELGNDTIICINEQINIDATQPRSTYLWNTGSINSSITVGDGFYKVKVTDVNNCSSLDSINVSLDIIPDPFPEKDFEKCSNEVLEITPSIGYESYSIEWPGYATGSFLEVREGGIYKSSVSSSYCSDTFEIVVTEIQTPNFEISTFPYSNKYCFERESAILNVNSDDLISSSYLWSTGDRTQNITVYSEGFYDVTVSNLQCKITKEIELIEFCPGNLFIPNAFTPDGDGVNDRFLPIGHHLIDYEIFIFDRWGLQLFSSKDINMGWDGRFRGNIAQQDVYVYKIFYSLENEEGTLIENSKVGTVTLIR